MRRRERRRSCSLHSPCLRWSRRSCRQVAPLPAEALVDVATLDQFRETFNAHVDKARLLCCSAPT